MSKKKVTAPLTYNPGKGRPKEHLAYLNWQEMQELQRINGGNVERGPGGLPSFPPKGAMSGNSARSPAATSKSKGAGSKSTGGGMKSGPGATGGGKTPARASPYGRTVESSRGVGTQKSAAQKAGMNARDAQFKQIAESTRASSALKKSAAAGPDLSKSGIKTLNVGPMGSPVNVKTGQAGNQIKGAISRTKEKTYTPARAALGAVTRGPGSLSGMIPGNNDPLAQERSLYSVTLNVNERLGTSYTPKQVSEMVRAVAGEAAGETPFGRAAVANTMLNRVALAQQDPKKYGYMGGSNFNKLMGQYDATGRRKGTTENTVFKKAKPGTETYRAGLAALSDATDPSGSFARTASPKVLNATHYYNPDTSNPKWGQKRSGREFETVGRHVFGNAEPTERAVSLARSQTGDMRVVPLAGEPGPLPSGGLMNFVPDSVKIGIAGKYAEGAGKKLAGYYKQGIEGLRDYFSPDAQSADGKVASGTKTFKLESGDIYGPKYVDPKIQEEMRKQDKRNKAGVRIAKTVTGPIGRVASAADALRKVFTGKTTTEATADLKRAYMQASPSQKAELEKNYPNLTKFAMDAGLEPQLPASNYTSWAQRSGLTTPDSKSGGAGPVMSGGIADITSTAGTGAAPSTTPSTASAAGARPYIYYEWDLGVNVPSPTDPKYTDYQKYLQERADAQKALGLV